MSFTSFLLQSLSIYQSIHTRSWKLRLKKATLGPSITAKTFLTIKTVELWAGRVHPKCIRENRPPAFAMDQNPNAIRFRRRYLEASKTSGKVDHRPSRWFKTFMIFFPKTVEKCEIRIRNAFARNLPPALAMDQNRTKIRFRIHHFEVLENMWKNLPPALTMDQNPTENDAKS